MNEPEKKKFYKNKRFWLALGIGFAVGMFICVTIFVRSLDLPKAHYRFESVSAEGESFEYRVAVYEQDGINYLQFYKFKNATGEMVYKDVVLVEPYDLEMIAEADYEIAVAKQEGKQSELFVKCIGEVVGEYLDACHKQDADQINDARDQVMMFLGAFGTHGYNAN